LDRAMAEILNLDTERRRIIVLYIRDICFAIRIESVLKYSHSNLSTLKTDFPFEEMRINFCLKLYIKGGYLRQKISLG
jgi:hypothetical protein